MSRRVLAAGVSCGESRRVVFGDPQNLENDCSTTVKPLFSEIHPSLKMVSFGHLFGPFWEHFPFHALPNGAQSAKKELSENIEKTIKF